MTGIARRISTEAGWLLALILLAVTAATVLADMNDINLNYDLAAQDVPFSYYPNLFFLQALLSLCAARYLLLLTRWSARRSPTGVTIARGVSAISLTLALGAAYSLLREPPLSTILYWHRSGSFPDPARYPGAQRWSVEALLVVRAGGPLFCYLAASVVAFIGSLRARSGRWSGALGSLLVVSLLLPAAPARAADCSLPTVHDEYLGLSFGRPLGWSDTYLHGVIVVRKDSRSLAFVYPVLPRAGPSGSARELAQSYFEVLRDAAKASGGALNLEGEEISGTLGGTAIRGVLSAESRGSEVVVSGGWSPATEWKETEGPIREVARCYRSIPGKLLAVRTRMMRDSAGDATTFRSLVPSGWALTDLSDEGFSVLRDERNGVGVVYPHPAPGSQTEEGFLQQAIARVGLVNVRLLDARPLDDVTDRLGIRWNLQTRGFRGEYDGQRVRGAVTVAVGNAGAFGLGHWSGLAVFRQADEESWPALAAVTAVIQESVRIVGAKPGRDLVLPRNDPESAEDGLLESPAYRLGVSRLRSDWSEVVMGFDPVLSPRLGWIYLAPRTGGAGGYYRETQSGKELLTPIPVSSAAALLPPELLQ